MAVSVCALTRLRGPLIGALVLVMTWAAGASAQRGIDIAPTRPIRIEGYWNRSRAERAVLGEVTISADGRERRTFGVTALQAYHPEEEGLHVLRHSALSPVTLLLRGREEMVRTFLGARPNEKVTALGVYRAASGMLTLISVEVSPETTP